MPRLSLLLFFALLLACTFFALNSVGDLPEKVAAHFDANAPLINGHHYRLSMLLLLVGLPTLLVLAMAALPRYTNGRPL
jgi:hypothetical protein